jgi:hypothetical protein
MAFLSRIWATTLMQTTLIRDETTEALSLDLPEHARFSVLVLPQEVSVVRITPDEPLNCLSS